MLINCDIGERGIDNPIDNQLMDYIHIANIACSGHAGDRESVEYFRALALERGVKVAAHLSYPDRENFGRTEMYIPVSELLDSLNRQYSLMEDVKRVKLHGALYNRCSVDDDLASEISQWFMENGVEDVLCPPGSALARACEIRDITVLAEAFAERTYTLMRETGRLILTPRTNPDAHLLTVESAFNQFELLCRDGMVEAWVHEEESYPHKEQVSLHAQTICIHSDSPIALDLARRLYNYE